MGVTKEQLSPGNGTDKPKQGDTITMEYTGNLYDDSASNKKGKQCGEPHITSRCGTCSLHFVRFDSSVGRGDFSTKIGVGQVIRGALLLSDIE